VLAQETQKITNQTYELEEERTNKNEKCKLEKRK
jgi:hypothetical protein